jgi:VIT1/CCC1 family predicted Fe2+/Mn2+ transporter
VKLPHFFMAVTSILLISTIALYFIGVLIPVADINLLKNAQSALVCLTIASVFALLIASDN